MSRYEVEDDDFTRKWAKDELPECLQEYLISMERTCDACPTQYDVTLADGRSGYFRYRHGGWRIDVEGETVASGAVWQMADGYLTHDEVCEIFREHRIELGVDV